MHRGDFINKGYIHVYTGNGKGKTTAAFGLALRALCNGKRVYIGQFVKDMKYNEVDAVNYFNNLTIEQLGKGCFIERSPDSRDIEAANKGLDHCINLINSNEFDIIILDELNIAIYLKLLDNNKVVQLLSRRKGNCEIIITGRYATDEIIEIADLVTEMKEIKHYYKTGIKSRAGIDR